MPRSAIISRDPDLKRRQFLAGLVLVLLPGLFFLGSGFLLDDTLHLWRLTATPFPQNLTCAIDPQILGLHLPAGPGGEGFQYFRPVTGLSLWLDHQLFGLRPLGFHLVNTFLHLANVMLVWLLGRRLQLKSSTAWLVAVIWGVSVPAGLATGWISGRSELLATLLVLTAALGVPDQARPQSGYRLPTVSLLLFLAPLAKESGVAGPLLIMFFLTARAGRFKMSARWLTAIWVPPLAALSLRLVLVGWPRIPEPYLQVPRTLEGLAGLLVKFLVYVAGGITGLPVVPFIQVQTLLQNWLWTLLLAVLVSAMLLILLRLIRGPARWALLGWFVAGLAPALLVMAFSFYLYLPLIGLCWLLGVAWETRPTLWLRAWLVWLAGCGLVLNLALGLGAHQINEKATAAVAALGHFRQESSGADVVFIDAPFWAYAVTVTLNLQHPDQPLAAHFINFSPALIPAQPSRVSWAGPANLSIKRDQGAFFTAPIEEFFLFGNDPCAAPGPGSPLRLNCPEPDVLLVDLPVPDLEPGLTFFQFRGWELHHLAQPGFGRPAAPPTD